MYFYLKDAAKNIGHCQTNTVWRAHVLDIAEKSIHNSFLFTDKYEMERVADPVTMDPIDWNFVPGDDEEWCFALSRHTFLLNNAKAAVITRDKRYSENWVRLFEDFYHNTTLCKETEKRSWRSLECGIRIENYIRSLELLESVSMAPSKDVYDDIKAFFRTHIDYLLSAHTAFHRLSNWGVLQDHGLFLASLYIGDEDSMKIAADRLDEEIALQTLPDGMHWEQSSMYHGEVLHAVLDTILVAQRQGIKLPERLIANTHCLALGLARSLRCDGKCYLYGDSDEIDMRDLVAEAAVLFSDPVLSGYAEGGLDEEFYLSSADWMYRNLDRRVELLFPVEDETIRAELITLLRCDATIFIVPLVVSMLAMLLDVSTIPFNALSWQIAKTPLSTAWMARIKFVDMFCGMTVLASVLSMPNSMSVSDTWNSSSTSCANMFQSARMFSFASLGTAMTNWPSRGIALCIFPELNSARRTSNLFISLYKNRPSILIALARFFSMSSPECPPLRPLIHPLMKK